MNTSILNEKSFDFITKYLNNFSPTGYESSGQKIWMQYLTPFVDEFYTDKYGTAVGIINPNAKFKVVIEAHADEISWYVNYISEDGLIYVVRNGGSDQAIAPSKKVCIHTAKGIVKGVFGWPAIHTRLRNAKDEASPKIENLFIDCGCESREEVEALGIHIGCVITYPDDFEILNKNKWVGRALDNRIGGFIIAEVARLLKENKKNLPFGLYIVNAVQEEVGLRGAEMIVESIKPDMAIITDVCHDTTTPMIDKKIEGEQKINKGPVIGYAPAIHNIVRDLIVSTAVENNIPFQRNALSRVTGTDTDAFAYANGGTPSALISLPLRYMHTTVEMAHQNDIENLILLIYNSLLKIKGNESFSYFE